MNSLAYAASIGREHGRNQRNSAKDEMKFFRNTFATLEEWYSYLSGFYRGFGYNGSGNRSMRKHRSVD